MGPTNKYWYRALDRSSQRVGLDTHCRWSRTSCCSIPSAPAPEPRRPRAGWSLRSQRGPSSSEPSCLPSPGSESRHSDGRCLAPCLTERQAGASEVAIVVSGHPPSNCERRSAGEQHEPGNHSPRRERRRCCRRTRACPDLADEVAAHQRVGAGGIAADAIDAEAGGGALRRHAAFATDWDGSPGCQPSPSTSAQLVPLLAAAHWAITTPPQLQQKAAARVDHPATTRIKK